MTHFLVTDDNPDGYKLEDMLKLIRKDIFLRTAKIMEDDRPEAQSVMDNNVKILGMISDAIAIAENSTSILRKSFGRSRSGKPRIGV